MEQPQKNNPLHGKTLEDILNDLVFYFNWDTLGNLIQIRCFNENPSIKSSLAFLRKTPWAREKVERLYMRYLKRINIKKADAIK
ncbi:MAG: VF530 family protein [Bacteroidota bacterium]